MGRYVRGDDTWELARDGATLTIVDNGTSTVEVLPSAKHAEARERVLLNARARDGFKLYRPPPPAIERPAPAPPQPIVHDARNPVLEQAILDDPDNLALYEVYGDWLQEQGDPRGRVIALERAALDKPMGDKHHIILDRYVTEHAAYLDGGFEAKPGRSLLVRHGFPSELELLAGRFAQVLRRFLPSSAWRFLTDLRLDCEADDDDPEAVARDLATSLALIAKHAPPTLRRLSLGGATRLDDLEVLAPRLPALRELALVNVADRELEVAPACLRTIVGSPFPRLEALELELLRGACTPAQVEPLFARRDLPALRSLAVRTTFDDELVELLIGSPLGAQLENLQLGWPGGPDGREGDADRVASALVAGRAALPALRSLYLPVARLGSSLRQRLGEAFHCEDHDGSYRYEHAVE